MWRVLEIRSFEVAEYRSWMECSGPDALRSLDLIQRGYFGLWWAVLTPQGWANCLDVASRPHLQAVGDFPRASPATQASRLTWHGKSERMCVPKLQVACQPRGWTYRNAAAYSSKLVPSVLARNISLRRLRLCTAPKLHIKAYPSWEWVKAKLVQSSHLLRVHLSLSVYRRRRRALHNRLVGDR
jgi:hypothetical protein